MKRAHLTAALAGIALLACQDQQLPTAPDTEAPSFAIMDGNAAGGNSGFFFLWPIRTLAQENAVPSVGFDATRLPAVQVQICRLPGCVLVKTLTMAPDPTAGSSTVNRVFVFPEQQEYAALWVARNLDLGKSYRIRVLVGGQELGFADVDVRARLRDVLTYDDRQNFVPLLKADGYTALPIRFWIGTGALDVNDAPTLDPIPDATIPQGSGQQTVGLSGITAGPGESQTLTVTAISGNPALIPHPTVTYTSPSSTGSLQYTPVASQSGSSIITVTVQDDGGTANGGVNTTSRSFTVTVTPEAVTTVLWDNPEGGDWNTASNWSTDALPTETQDVIIDIAVRNPVTHSAGTTQIKSLTSNQPTSLAGGTFIVAGALQLSNAAGSIGASLTAGGSITLVDPGSLTIGSNINAGTNPLTITAGGAISQGAGTVTAGLLALNAGASIDMGNVAVTSLMISSGTGAVSVSDAGGVTLTAVAVHGILELATTGSLVINGNVTSGANVATLSATGGAITQTGGTVTAGALDLNAGTGINLTAAAIDGLEAANAAGAVSVVDATTNLNILGTGVASGGDVTLATPGTLTLTSNVTATGATANLTCGTATQAGGTVNATSLVLNTTAGATLTNLGVTNLTATNTTSGALTLSATGSLTAVAVVNSVGPITLSAPVSITVSGNVNAGANTLTLASATGSIGQSAGSITAGSAVLNAGTGISVISGSIANLSATNAGSGHISITGLASGLNVAAGGVTNHAPTGDVTLATAGNLILTGDVTVQTARSISLAGQTIASVGGEPISQSLLLTTVNGVTLSNLAATRLSAVNTGAGNITLSVQDDATIVGSGLTNSNGNITLTSPGFVHIESGSSASGHIGISAGDEILVASSVSSQTITLSGSSIIDASDADMAAIGVLNLTAVHNITLGDETNNQTSAGSLIAVTGAAGSISYSADGSVVIRSLTSPGGFAVVAAEAGSITDVSSATVQAATLALTAATSITLGDEPGNSIDVDVLSGHAGTGPIAFTNTGDLQITGVLATPGNLSLTTSGNLTIPGTVDVGGAATLTATNTAIGLGGTVSSAGGTLATGNLTNQGTLRLGAAGQAGVTGNFTNTSEGVLRVDVAGGAPGAFTRFTIGGVAALDGTLEAALVGGFVPAADQRFQFMTFGSRVGFFDTTNLPPDFTVDQSDPNDLELVAGP